MTAGAQEAAAALQRLLRVPVQAEGPSGAEAGLAGAERSVAEVAGTHGPRVVVVVFQASGGISGNLALVIDDAVAQWLVGHLTGAVTLDGEIGAGALAALAELGNIVASAFLNGAARVVGRTCLPSVPRVIHSSTSEALIAAVKADTSLRVATLRTQQQWFSVILSG
jgi:chemotaxis protein CheY-P-specific phosphatase CheC